MFDLSSAYDVLDRDLFLQKAEICGFDNVALEWFRSYLSERSQVVQVGNCLSTEKLLECGTPQGSSCSCTIFAFFVGDLGHWVRGGLVGAFADDSFVSVDADSEDELKTNLERVGEDVLRFFASNNMVANASNTAMLIFRQRGSTTPFRITLAGEEIVEAEEEDCSAFGSGMI